MSVTINFTFEKKHFLMMGLILALPFLILAISNIIATTPAPTGQYHTANELYINQDIEMNGFNLNNSGNISINGSENGIIFPDGSIQNTASSNSESLPSSALWTHGYDVSVYNSFCGSRSAGWNTLCYYTVGPRGGYMGLSTLSGDIGGCYSGAKQIKINGLVQTTNSERVYIPLPPNAYVEIQDYCKYDYCTASSAATCTLNLWDY